MRVQRAIYDPGITVTLILSMNSNATLAQVPEAHYGTTLGALLLGALFMYALLGLLISQTYSYFRTFPEDWVGLKLLVGGMFVSDIVHSICVTHPLYILTITNHDNPAAVAHPPTTLTSNLIPALGVRFLAGLFYTHRIWKLTRNRTFGWILLAMDLIALSLGLTSCLYAVQRVSPSGYTPTMFALIPATLAIALVFDIVSSVTLVWWCASRRESGTKSTQIICDKIIIATVQTGLITTIASIMLLVTFVTMHDNFIWLSIQFFLPKLYSNSVLSSLNGRAVLRRGTNVIEEPTIGGIYFRARSQEKSNGQALESSLSFWPVDISDTVASNTSERLDEDGHQSVAAHREAAEKSDKTVRSM
ncbi:hypothetical protein CPB85DRAFT_279442 [Mucidula mucida]|nr:hypothetical protein CPB85DRAFT_279442 [Mucidula mucida]